ncbi:MAG: hypothetical protein Q7K45_00270 [Nanoarchaeota archaeon]|nr:hypothetical protein [Nanoarchaeota archaeon]
MTTERLLAIVDVHGRLAIAEADSIDRLNKQVDEILELPNRHYPNFDFTKDVRRFRVEERR